MSILEKYSAALKNEDGSHELPEILKKYQFSRPR